MSVDVDSTEELAERIVDAIPNEVLDVESDDRLTAIVNAVAEVLHEYEVRVERVLEDSAVTTAEGDALDELAKPVGIKRLNEEGDESFRKRLLAAYARSISDTTIEAVADVTLLLLEADRSQVTFLGADYGREEPIVVIETEQSAVADSPVEAKQIGELVADSVPMGHGVAIRLTFGHRETVAYTDEAREDSQTASDTMSAEDDAQTDGRKYTYGGGQYNDARYQASGFVD